MPPKNKKTQQEDAVILPIDNEQIRLQERAFDQGVLSRTRRVCSTILKATKLMIRADGKDIVKKSSSRRNRYLLIFNCQIAPAAAGKLGTLAQLDSRNPVMYIEFLEGRLKLFGTLTFPNNKYMVLKLGNKEALCEDVLESMIVFSEAWWVGSAAENPEEHQLTMPASLQQPRHEKYNFNGRGDQDGKDGAEAALDEEDMMLGIEEGDDDVPLSQRPHRASARTARGKRQRYREDSDGGGESEEDSQDSGAPASRKLPKVQLASQQKERKQQRQQPKRDGSQGEEDGSVDEVVLLSEGTGGGGGQKQGTLDTFVKKPATAVKTTPKPTAGAAASRAPKSTTGARRPTSRQRQSVDVMDLAGSSGDEHSGDAQQSQQPLSGARPRRAAAGAAARRLKIESDADDGGDKGESDTEAGGSVDDGSRGASGHGSDGDASAEVDDGDEGAEEEELASASEEGSDYQPSD